MVNAAPSMWEEFYAVIRLIPRGKVATYGAVAEWAGRPRSARHVGYALAALKERRGAHRVPWQRVVGSKGRGFAGVTIRDPIGAAVQRQLLEAEGVALDLHARVALARFGWRGPARKRRRGQRAARDRRR
jgi:methylated-DNA-protein-cysteine methyltransferase-like protein